MVVRLAHITLERPLRVWRLRLDPDATGDGDKAGDLIGFSGNIRDPDDELRVTMHLAGWGVHPEPGGWRDAAGTWVVPVVRLEMAVFEPGSVRPPRKPAPSTPSSAVRTWRPQEVDRLSSSDCS